MGAMGADAGREVPRWRRLIVVAVCGPAAQLCAAWGSSWIAAVGAAALFGAGGFALARLDAGRREPDGLGSEDVPTPPSPAPRFVPLAAAFLIVAGAATHAGAELYPLQIVGHVVALLLILSESWARDRTLPFARTRPGVGEGGAFLVILAIAVALRFWRLGELPPLVWEGEILYLQDAIGQLDGNAVSPYAAGNWGAPLIHAYLIAGASLAVDHVLALRLVSAIPSALSVALLYLLLRDLFGRRFAIAGTFLLAIAAWNVIHARYGYVWSISVLGEMLALCGLVRGLRSGRLVPFVLSGLGLGLCVVYAYAQALMPLVLIPFAVLLTFMRPRLLRARVWGLAMLAFTAGVAAAPRLTYYAAHSEARDYHRGTVTVLADEAPFDVVLERFEQVAVAFNHRADNWDAFVPRAGDPLLDPITATAFGLGVFWAVFSWRRLGAVLLLLAFAVMLVPPAVTYAEAGWAISWRACGVVPALFGFAGAPFAVITGAFTHRWARAVAVALLAPLLLLATFVNLHAYFVRHPRKPVWYRGRAAMYWQASQTLLQEPTTTHVAVAHDLEWPYIHAFAWRVRPYTRFVWPDDRALPSFGSNSRDTLVLARRWEQPQDDVSFDPALLDLLEHYYPLGTRVDTIGSDGAALLGTYRLTPDEIRAAHGLRQAEVPGAPSTSGRARHAAPPVEVELAGTLLIPQSADYTLIASGIADAVIQIDGGIFRGGHLDAGLHQIHARGRKSGESGLQWSRDGGLVEPVPEKNLLRQDLPRWGVRQTIRTPRGTHTMWQPLLGRVDTERPAAAPDATVEWDTDFIAPESGPYLVLVRASSPSSLWVDGAPVVTDMTSFPDWQRVEIDLAAGRHSLRARTGPPIEHDDLQVIFLPPSGHPLLIGGEATQLR